MEETKDLDTVRRDVRSVAPDGGARLEFPDADGEVVYRIPEGRTSPAGGTGRGRPRAVSGRRRTGAP